MVVAGGNGEVAEELCLLGFYPDLAVPKNYEEVVVCYCSLVCHSQLEMLLC